MLGKPLLPVLRFILGVVEQFGKGDAGIQLATSAIVIPSEARNPYSLIMRSNGTEEPAALR